jgi:V8-like Glu-specific endopeptidase
MFKIAPAETNQWGTSLYLHTTSEQSRKFPTPNGASVRAKPSRRIIAACVTAIAAVASQSVAAAGPAAQPPEPAGSSVGAPTRGSNVVNGRATTTTDFPALADIAIGFGGTNIASCSGTLIAPTWIMTAAHCLVEDTLKPAPGPVFAALGSGPGDGEIVQGKRWIVHPKYTGENYPTAFDIALIELTKPAATAPATLLGPLEAAAAAPGVTGSVIGYGSTTPLIGGNPASARFPSVAQIGAQRILDAASQGFRETSRPFYDIYFLEGEASAVSACIGDSGGPFVVTTTSGAMRVAGVTSTGAYDDAGNRCNPPTPLSDDYTRVLPQLGWILSTTGPGPIVGSPGTAGRFAPWPADRAARILDTRSGVGANGPQAWGSIVKLPLNISGASAAFVNVTVTGPSTGGGVWATSCDGAASSTEHLDFDPNETVANVVMVPVSADGSICLRSSTSVQLVADMVGTISASGTEGIASIDPVRVIDTRTTGVKVAAGTVLRIPVRSAAPAIPADATGIMATLTVTEGTGPGYLTAYSCDRPQPTASNLNFARNQIVPNTVLVPLAADGSICVFSFATAHVLLDVAGWTGPSAPARLTPVGDISVFDTFNGLGGLKALAANTETRIKVRGTGIVPDSATAVTLTISTATSAQASFITVHPCASPRPTVSNSNIAIKTIRTNSVLVPLSADGFVCVYNQSSASISVGVSGYLS